MKNTVKAIMERENLTLKETMVLLSIISSDFYENGYDSGVWNNVFCDEVPGMSAKQVGALLVTLSKKNFVNLGEEYFEVTGKFQDFMEAFEVVGIKGDDSGKFNRDSCEIAKDIVSTISENLEKAKAKKTQVVKAEAAAEIAPEVEPEPATEEVKAEPKKTKSTKKTKAVVEEKPEEPAATPASNTVTLKAFTGMIIGEFSISKMTKKVITIITGKGELTFDRSTLKQMNAKNPKFANRIELA